MEEEEEVVVVVVASSPNAPLITPPDDDGEDCRLIDVIRSSPLYNAPPIFVVAVIVLEEVALDALRILVELALEFDLVDDDEEEDCFKSTLSLLDGRGLSPPLGVIFVAIPPPPPPL